MDGHAGAVRYEFDIGIATGATDAELVRAAHGDIARGAELNFLDGRRHHLDIGIVFQRQILLATDIIRHGFQNGFRLALLRPRATHGHADNGHDSCEPDQDSRKRSSATQIDPSVHRAILPGFIPRREPRESYVLRTHGIIGQP